MVTTPRTLLARHRPRGDAHEGQGLVEYALIILLVAVATVAVLGGFGGAVNVLYEFINAGLPF
jgi:Flp pilus assembly pilin Flp